MAKKESVSGPPTAETRNAILEVLQATAAPVTATQISKLLIAPYKLAERKLIPVLDEFVAVGTLRSIPPSTAKGKPRYWDRDIVAVARAAVVAAMRQAPEPVTASEMAGKIVSTVKFNEGDLTPILNDLVALHVLYAIPAKTTAGKPRFWNRDLREFVRVTVLQVLNSKGPQTSANLKKAVKGLNDSQFQQQFEDLIAARTIVLHPPLSKKSKALFGSQPPTPELYLREVGTTLTRIVGQLKSAHVPVENLRRALIQLIEAAGVPFGQSPAPSAKASAAPPSGAIDLIGLMRRIEPGADRGALVAPRALRSAAQLDKEEFDRAILDLAAAGKISLHRHDYVASLTAAERDELVTDGAGAYYVGLALRQIAESQTHRTDA